MKKIVLSISKWVIRIALVLLFVCGSAVNAQKSKSFVYDKSKNTVFLYDSVSKALTPHLKYELSYNENGQLKSKMAYRWDISKEKWVPFYLRNIAYVGEGLVQEFVQWNNQKNNFSFNRQVSIHHKDVGSDVITYIAFVWCEKCGRWEVSDSNRFENDIELLVNNLTK